MVELNTLKAQLQPYLDGDNKLNELNTQLVTAELEKQDLRQQLTQAHQAFLPTARQSPPHPDPDVYEGDSKSLSTFIREVQAKLSINADWYISKNAKMIYLKSRLRGKAYNAVIYGFDKEGSISFESISTIVALLKQSFGNTDEEGTAQTNIMKLKQLHKLTIEFLNDWSQKTQLMRFDNKSKIVLLKNVLHPELLICLQHLQLSKVPISSNFPGFLA